MLVSHKAMHRKRVKLVALGAAFGAIMLLSLLVDGAYERYLPRPDELTITRRENEPLKNLAGAVQQDAKGRQFLLQQSTASVSVYNPKTRQTDGVLILETREKKPRRQDRDARRSADVQLGAGIVLLHNGHILAIKARSKAGIYEFGPLLSDVARGYTSHGGNRKKPSFSIADGEIQTFYSLKEWKVPQHLKGCNLSEINRNSLGEIYVLSQNCEWIVKVGALLPEESHFEAQKLWYLPRKLRNPVGFVALPNESFVVAGSTHFAQRDNLFFLSKMKI